jgi:hypothetical protein
MNPKNAPNLKKEGKACQESKQISKDCYKDPTVLRRKRIDNRYQKTILVSLCVLGGSGNQPVSDTQKDRNHTDHDKQPV